MSRSGEWHQRVACCRADTATGSRKWRRSEATALEEDRAEDEVAEAEAARAAVTCEREEAVALAVAEAVVVATEVVATVAAVVSAAAEAATAASAMAEVPLSRLPRRAVPAGGRRCLP